MTVACATCGWYGPAPTYGCVRVGLVIVLAFLFILPGILYAWYADEQRKECPSCGAKTLVPASSPRGRQIIGLDDTQPRR